MRVSNSLDPDQAQHLLGPDLGPNYLQRLSADDIRIQKVKAAQTIGFGLFYGGFYRFEAIIWHPSNSQITFDNTAAKGISTSLNYFDRVKQDGESFNGEQQQAPDQGDSQVHGPSWT